MSDPLSTKNQSERLANGYLYEISELEQELKTASDHERMEKIARTLKLKRWHLQRHLDDLAIQTD